MKAYAVNNCNLSKNGVRSFQTKENNENIEIRNIHYYYFLSAVHSRFVNLNDEFFVVTRRT